MEKGTEYRPQDSYLRVATACPEVSVADVANNVERITELYNQAAEQDVQLVVFPELSITGYSLGDLVQQNILLKKAEAGLLQLAEVTKDKNTAMVVGLPLRVQNGLYNCAAVLAQGGIMGIVPKQNMPNNNEFYEKRWFQKWENPVDYLQIGNQTTVFGNELLFDIAGTTVGVEICEDLWVMRSPHIEQVEQGAQVIANPSASPELVGKAGYRRDLVAINSAEAYAGYIYAGADWTESTMDTVLGNHQMIAENGRIIAEHKPFAKNKGIMRADIDIDHLEHDRFKETNIANKIGWTVMKTRIVKPEFVPNPNVNPHPFLPTWENEMQRSERLQSIIDIQAHALARRVMTTGSRKLHLGLSGGLDSTLAFMVAIRTAEILDMEPKDLLRTYTMPGEASSDRTQDNAVKLAKLYKIPNEVLPINELTDDMLDRINYSGDRTDITYENVQARTRTEILFNKANQLGGMNLGTGDLSEIALGWCTFNADQMSAYHVNAGIPKTLVKHLVKYTADHLAGAEARAVLKDIIDTPISPELVKAKDEKEIQQKTEDQIGPYELHDFFLYHLIRWGDEPDKIRFLAKQVEFDKNYSHEEVDKWLGVFLKRFSLSQFKRSPMPDGAKVGSVALSPRGDWRMPSDLMNDAVWK